MRTRDMVSVAWRPGAVSRMPWFARWALRVLLNCCAVVGGAFVVWLGAGLFSGGPALASATAGQVVTVSQVVPMKKGGSSGGGRPSGGHSPSGHSSGDHSSGHTSRGRKVGAEHKSTAKPTKTPRSTGSSAGSHRPHGESSSPRPSRGSAHEPQSGSRPAARQPHAAPPQRENGRRRDAHGVGRDGGAVRAAFGLVDQLTGGRNRPHARDDTHGYGKPSRFLDERVQALCDTVHEKIDDGVVEVAQGRSGRIVVELDHLF